MLPDEGTDPKPIERNDLWKQLSHAIQMRASGDQIVWTTLSIFWAANALLLSSLFRSGDYPNPQVGAIIAGFGSLLSVLWALIEKRLLARLGMHERIIKTIQAELLPKDRPDLAVCQRVDEADDKREVGEGLPARLLVPWSIRVVGFIWLAGFICFLTVAVQSHKR